MTTNTTKLAKQLFATWPHMIRAIKHVIHSEGLPIAQNQLRILKYVHEGLNSITDLAEQMYVRKPTISAAVDTLVKKGYLKRARLKSDRRAIALTLTAQGKRLLDSTHKRVIGIIDQHLVGLNAAEQRTVHKAMTILERAFTQK